MTSPRSNNVLRQHEVGLAGGCREHLVHHARNSRARGRREHRAVSRFAGSGCAPPPTRRPAAAGAASIRAQARLEIDTRNTPSGRRRLRVERVLHRRRPAAQVGEHPPAPGRRCCREGSSAIIARISGPVGVSAASRSRADRTGPPCRPAPPARESGPRHLGTRRPRPGAGRARARGRLGALHVRATKSPPEPRATSRCATARAMPRRCRARLESAATRAPAGLGAARVDHHHRRRAPAPARRTASGGFGLGAFFAPEDDDPRVGQVHGACARGAEVSRVGLEPRRPAQVAGRWSVQPPNSLRKLAATPLEQALVPLWGGRKHGPAGRGARALGQARGDLASASSTYALELPLRGGGASASRRLGE